VFDPLTGHTYSVNGTGLLILDGLKQGLAPGEIAERLSATHEVDQNDDPLRDVEDFLAQLKKHSLYA
jgi:hypothetical protein